jgi:AAA family ATP:ADP antiporter
MKVKCGLNHSTMGKKLFAAMFGIVALLNVGYGLLRSVRNALAVVDLGGGAGSIPVYEILGSMPGAILMTLGLTWLLNRFSMRKVFSITMSAFVGFFLVFAFAIYPALAVWKNPWAAQSASLLFFTMAELWKIALVTVLFWGFVNQCLPLDQAKKYYAPLMLAGSLGTFLSGPLISICTKSSFVTSWEGSLALMMGALALMSVLAVWLFSYLWRTLSTQQRREESPSSQEPLSVWESIRVCFRSKYLLLLAWITVADYIAYTLGEVIFLDVLKQLYPDPRDYCNYMGKLSEWSSILTAISALVIAPILLRKCRWTVASLITPLCLLIIEAAFFFALWHPALSKQLGLLAALGTTLFCVVRAAKYTLFDTSKEISFLLLPPLEKMQGKLVIDGMCSRIGRGGASLLTIGLIQISGGVLASSGIAGTLALLIAGTCALATSRLGVLIDKRAQIPS